MISLQMDNYPVNILLNDLISGISKIKDNITYEFIYRGSQYAIALLNKNIEYVNQYDDIRYLDLIKNIDFDKFYDKYQDDREKIEIVYKTLENKTDIKSKKLLKCMDNILDSFIRLEMAYSRLEDLIILDKRCAS